MLSAEHNDLLTRIGPGTAAGKLMRCYWQPAALVDETVGVFAGVMWNHYQLFADSDGGVAPTAMHASIANRVSLAACSPIRLMIPRSFGSMLCG